MINDSKLKRRKEIFWMILFCLLFFMTTSMIRNINLLNYSISLLGMTLDIRSLSGVINVIQIGILIILVLINYRTGTKLSFFLLILSTIALIKNIMRSHSLGAMPGMFMNITGAIILIIISMQLRKNDENLHSLEKIAITDALTGLPNKYGMISKIAKENESRSSFFLMQVDLDNFKMINESMGQRVGDEVIKIVANRLNGLDVNGGIVCRSDGAVFLLLVKRKSDYDIDAFAQQCIDTVGEMITIPEYNYKGILSVNIGICHCPVHGRDQENLLKYVDMAVNEAKKKGKNKSCFFTGEMESRLRRKLDVEEYTRLALEKDRFFMVYQPQYDASTKKLRGFESLIRMKKGDGEPVSPAEFIPIAEGNGMIKQIDQYVIKKVLMQFRDKVVELGDNITISVNISAQNMVEEGFAKKICDAVDEVDFPPKCLEIELTEYCLLASMEKAYANIKILRDHGIGISLDDFGTGYSSLSYLAKLPIDILKIDKSFVDDIENSQVSRDFVETIISLGQLLKCEIVCEGVETQGQLDILKNQGCDYIQGYIWGKPMEYEEAIKLL